MEHMQVQMDRLVQMVEDLTTWSGALNPVVSMLLEGMDDACAMESENVEAWLDCSEKA